MRIEGEKIVFRYPQEKDAKWLLKNITRSEVSSTLSNPHLIGMTLEKELKWIKMQKVLRKKQKEINWVILEKDSKKLVGVCGFNKIEKYYNYGEIGAWIAPEYWGRGYATAAIKLLLKYGFEKLGFNRIGSQTLTANIGSLRAQEKAGLKREGILKQRLKYKGKPHDEYINAILKSEWEVMNK